MPMMTLIRIRFERTTSLALDDKKTRVLESSFLTSSIPNRSVKMGREIGYEVL